ncbi:MAG: PEP-CTERM sorting domain-containing protein [Pirellulales bacterium]|nr:PEP-CTERM sorting domain-containing protein [Pirellulales bacterium]
MQPVIRHQCFVILSTEATSPLLTDFLERDQLMKTRKLSTLVSIAAFAAIAFFATNTIYALPFSNGGFEDYTNATNNMEIDDGTPISWIEVGMGNPQIESTGRQSGTLDGPQEGTYHLIFDFLDEGAAGQDDLAGVYQTFDTVAGAKYDLSFYAAVANNIQGPMLLDVDVFTGGNGVDGDLLDETVIVSAPGWTQSTFTFVAGTTTTTIRFWDDGKQSDPGNTEAIDLAVDNIVIALAPVPEPSTLILAGIGLMGLVAPRRRRNRS